MRARATLRLRWQARRAAVGSIAKVLLLLPCGFASSPSAAQSEARSAVPRAEVVAASLAGELSHLCPATDPGSQAAFDVCRRGLYQSRLMRAQLPDYVLWGRQRDPTTPLKETRLTQFGPDVFTGMYISLFMFNGKYSVDWVEREGHCLIRLQTAFRNRLQPGQFPYPFWHDADKWATYQNANEILLWWDPKTARIRVAQFTRSGAKPPIVVSTPVSHPNFDGQWMWTDSAGTSQPAVTLFDGLFAADNPHLAGLDAAYRKFALRLRDGQCVHCHVPDNPDGMKKLVLLQTPAHAAAEIQRVLESVRKDRMPRDEIGIEAPLDDRTKAALLDEGTLFAELVEAARRWEAAHGLRSVSDR